MDLIREYDFDILPYIDRDYDHPLVQEKVHSLISAEMRTFTPGNYLSYLPLKDLKFSHSQVLKSEFKRLEHGLAAPQFDNSRYSVEKPEPPLDKDVQAWRSCVNNAKSQLIHQTNRIMNLEVIEENNISMWLVHNNTTEKHTQFYQNKTEEIKKQIRLINKSRQMTQEEILPEIIRLKSKSQTSLLKKLQIQKAFLDINNKLLGQKLSYSDYLLELEEQKKREEDENNGLYNNTVREYETVRVDGVVELANDMITEDEIEILNEDNNDQQAVKRVKG
eukprot:gene11244-15088_t